jgi:hypothetical protein
MNSGWRRWLFRLVLFGILGGLLAYIWMTDRPSPPYPRGQFGELVFLALASVGLVGILTVVAKWLGWRRGP